MKIKQAIIPAAGFGTRMLPAAKAVPKELLPVLDRPAIQYVVEEATAASVHDVLLVTSPQKPAIEEHFSSNDQLRARLRAAGRDELLHSINDLIEKARIRFVHQHEQRGLGHAVAQARQHVDQPFLCMLGDTIFSGEPSPARQLVDAFDRLGTAVIGLEQVPPEKVSRYGIAGGEMIEHGLLRIDTLIEKPAPQDAPSRFAIAARYVLTPAIFDCLDHTVPGSGGEIQLTDALHLFLKEQQVHGVVLAARRHDIGNPIDWLMTNLFFARRDEQTWRQIRPLLDELPRA